MTRIRDLKRRGKNPKGYPVEVPCTKKLREAFFSERFGCKAVRYQRYKDRLEREKQVAAKSAGRRKNKRPTAPAVYPFPLNDE